MPKAIIITTNGGITTANLDDLAAMQAVVGGLIEPVSIGHGRDHADIYVNEEGLLIDLPPNPVAQAIVRAVSGEGRQVAWMPLGDVFILGPINDEGDATDCPVSIAFTAMEITKKARR